MSEEEALIAEATETPITVTWEGHTLTLPPTADDWDVDDIEAIEQGKAITFLRGVLGSKRFDDLKKAMAERLGRNVRAKDLTPLVNAVLGAYGYEPGE